MFSINLGERNGKMLDLLENHDSSTRAFIIYRSSSSIELKKFPLSFNKIL